MAGFPPCELAKNVTSRAYRCTRPLDCIYMPERWACKLPGSRFPKLRRVQDVEGHADAVVDAIRARAQNGAAGLAFQLFAEGRTVLGAEPRHQLAHLLVGRALRLRVVRAIARREPDDGAAARYRAAGFLPDGRS